MPVLGYARLGKARLNAFRLGYRQPFVMITFGGTTRTSNTRVAGLRIRDYLNGQPNIATMRVDGFTPTLGQEVKIGLGSLQTSCLVFGGRVQQVQQVAEGKRANVAYDVTAVSYEAFLNVRRVFAKYVGRSASYIVREIVSTFSNSVSTTHVQTDLDTIDEVTFTNEDVTDALDRIAKRIGASWYIDYARDLHFFTTSEGSVHDITTGTEAFKPADIVSGSDLSQVRTRIYSEGGGSVTSTDVTQGQSTIPVDDASWYSSSGGTIVAGPQFITYTDRHLGGTGSTVSGKTGLSPSALTASVASGTAGELLVGTRTYKLTYVINGGETEAGTASSSATISAVSAPSTGPALSGTTGGSLTASAKYYYKVSYIDDVGETLAVYAPGTNITLSGGQNAVSLTSIPTSADGRVTGRRIYRTGANELGYDYQFALVTTIANNSATTYTDTTADASRGAVPPTTNTTGTGQINLTSIPTGPTGTTARRVYRTEGDGATHKFAFQISDNSTTSTTDNIADSSLGAEVSTASHVGASVGDTSLRVADTGQFNSAGAGSGNGGWATVGGQLIRFTGRSASSGDANLTGIPSSGTGSITSAIPYGTPIVMAPHLVGVSGVSYSIPSGEPVNVLAQSDDSAAQSALLALMGTGDGIVVDYLQDNRLSLTEAQNRGDAHLELVKDPLTSISYRTRDQTTRTGLDVTINLSSPTNISGTFKIQSVVISGFDPDTTTPTYWPDRQVEASSRRFTLESLLRLLRVPAA